MQTILGLNCIYDTARQSWAIELTLDGGTTHRFPISPDQVETLVEAFDDCSRAGFDPATGEVVFAFEYEEYEDEEDEEEEEEGEGEEDEESEEDEVGEAKKEKKPDVEQKGQGGKSSKSSGSAGKRPGKPKTG